MAEQPTINLLDDEYMTPQQRAELRKTMTELPLWQEMEQPATPGASKPETTIDAAQVQKDVEAPANVSSGFSADIAAHRALNGTTGMESEP